MTTRTSDIILACFFPKHGDVQLNMIGRENGEQPTPNRFRRGRISLECREQIKTAYASGIGLREIARNMGIPEGTVLARAQREGWTREIQNAKALAASILHPLSQQRKPPQSACSNAASVTDWPLLTRLPHESDRKLIHVLLGNGRFCRSGSDERAFGGC